MSKDLKTQWGEERIEKHLKEMISQTHQTTFPTHTEMAEFFKDYRLSNAVRRHGGTRYWAEKLGMEVKDCESKFGDDYEERFIVEVMEKCGLQSSRCRVRYPYDVLVEDCVKIDVKSSNRVIAHGFEMYSSNIEKDLQTCDVYVIYCIENGDVSKTYIIPSVVLSGKTQFSVGVKSSKYDKFLNRWDIITKYVEFMKSCE